MTGVQDGGPRQHEGPEKGADVHAERLGAPPGLPVPELPCDDLSCEDCHPDEQHTCDGPVFNATEPYTCPVCGVVWTRTYSIRQSPGLAVQSWSADRRVPTWTEIAARAQDGA